MNFRILKDEKIKKKFFESIQEDVNNLVYVMTYTVYVCFVETMELQKTIEQNYPDDVREISFQDLFNKIYGLTHTYLEKILSDRYIFYKTRQKDIRYIG